MPTCLIDGQKVEFEPGENLVEVAQKIGIEIPVFCYHPGLSVVAQCRMCMVEVEKTPKLQTACSTIATEGMVVHTQSDPVLQARESVMEFLLINHPLDCPICDKSGECDLQDFSYEHGSSYMRYSEDRRTFLDLDMGPVIEKNMNRCIHCTRCIRFGDEIAGMREMVALQRGNNTEISTLDGRSLETDYAGNYADICPTGSLTLKDFRFKKRAWMLKKTPSVCEGCSRGCNLEIHQDNGVIHRCLPRENLKINRYWLCDEGRFNFRNYQRKDRWIEPRVGLAQSDWKTALDQARTLVENKKVQVLVGTDLTQEEFVLVQDFASKYWKASSVQHFGTPGIQSNKDDGPADPVLKMKSKTANLAGAEKLGIQPFKQLDAGTELIVVIRGGRATLPKLSGGTPVLGIGVFFDTETTAWKDDLKVILPTPGFGERSGTVVNFEGVEQKMNRAILPPRTAKELAEVFMMWAHQKSELSEAEVSTGVA